MCRAQSADPRRRRAPVETVKSIRPARPVTAAALVTAAAPPHPVQSRRLWHGAASAHHDATGASIASHRIASRRVARPRAAAGPPVVVVAATTAVVRSAAAAAAAAVSSRVGRFCPTRASPRERMAARVRDVRQHGQQPNSPTANRPARSPSSRPAM